MPALPWDLAPFCPLREQSIHTVNRLGLSVRVDLQRFVRSKSCRPNEGPLSYVGYNRAPQ